MCIRDSAGLAPGPQHRVGRLAKEGQQPDEDPQQGPHQQPGEPGPVGGVFEQGGHLSQQGAGLVARRGLPPDALKAEDPVAYRERQFDMLEQTLRRSLDLPKIYQIMEEGVR